MPKKAINTTLSFTEDFQQTVTEPLKAGSEVTILFDSNRLPFERSTNEKGKAEWSISAFYQFAANGKVNEVKLTPAKKGKTVEKTILKGVLSVPQDANEAILWFLNTGKSGNYYFDSAFGQNYRFPVVTETVETPAPTKKSRAKKA
jgi:hypothetical protein